MELDPLTYQKVLSLCQTGDQFAENQKFEQAIREYQKALAFLPEPIKSWEAATWLYSAIGDAYFFSSDFDQVLSAFQNAIQSPAGIGNPFIHLRLGQAYFELGAPKKALDELTRAYMSESREIFEQEDPKYLKFLLSHLDPPMDSKP